MRTEDVHWRSPFSVCGGAPVLSPPTAGEARRHDLGNAAPGPFTSLDILYASEIAFVVDDVPATAETLRGVAGVEQYRGGSDQFLALGDERGLLLVMRRGRNLGLASPRRRAADVFSYFFAFGAETNSAALILVTLPADVRTYPPSVGTSLPYASTISGFPASFSVLKGVPQRTTRSPDLTNWYTSGYFDWKRSKSESRAGGWPARFVAVRSNCFRSWRSDIP
jgi:hypothetical protein